MIKSAVFKIDLAPQEWQDFMLRAEIFPKNPQVSLDDLPPENKGSRYDFLIQGVKISGYALESSFFSSYYLIIPGNKYDYFLIAGGYSDQSSNCQNITSNCVKIVDILLKTIKIF